MTSQINPFILKGAYKDYLWGGTRLIESYHKTDGCHPLAESWEASTHPDGSSIVDSGIYKGYKLDQLLLERPELLGKKYQSLKQLPILIKWIDAKADLSVQVHPDDDYAYTYEHGQNGKSELWYVVDADDNCQLIYGLAHDITKAQFSAVLHNNKIMNYVSRVAVHPNDVFYIPAGTIHAIGKGALIIEIQENSNLTYRLYDYNRRDKDGKLRELHLDKAYDVSNLNHSDLPKQPLRKLNYRQGYASELLRRTPYFQVDRILLNTQTPLPNINNVSFTVFTVFEGSLTVVCDDETLQLDQGMSLFIPAQSKPFTFSGQCKFLSVKC